LKLGIITALNVAHVFHWKVIIFQHSPLKDCCFWLIVAYSTLRGKCNGISWVIVYVKARILLRLYF